MRSLPRSFGSPAPNPHTSPALLSRSTADGRFTEMRATTTSGQRFAAKTVIVTGAAQGIGAAAALRFLKEGARVAVIDREEFGAPFAGAPPGMLLAITGDCTDANVLRD